MRRIDLQDSFEFGFGRWIVFTLDRTPAFFEVIEGSVESCLFVLESVLVIARIPVERSFVLHHCSLVVPHQLGALTSAYRLTGGPASGDSNCQESKNGE